MAECLGTNWRVLNVKCWKTAPAALTVAMNMTVCPVADGFTEEFTTVVVAAWFTTWLLAAGPLLPVKLLSPL